MSSEEQGPAYLKSTFPVLFPTHPALFYTPEKFEAFLQTKLIRYQRPDLSKIDAAVPIRDFAFLATNKSENEPPASGAATGPPSTSWADIAKAGLRDEMLRKAAAGDGPFIKALLSHDPSKPVPLPSHLMSTENGDVAHRSSNNSLVDLFYELEDVVVQDRLDCLLKAAWDESAVLTLKIIFNARSIHLGKSSRKVFYRCLDWLSIHHPVTCILNLQWLPRPVIEKKVAKKDGEEEIVFVEAEKSEDDTTRYDVRNGVAHGYYKDLLNILALTVNRSLHDPEVILNVRKDKAELEWDAQRAASIRHRERTARHKNAIKAFGNDPFYRGLHLMIARIFADQLRTDLKLLRSGDKNALRQISLCAKWAPSSKLFHDKHTFIVSSIAELLHAQDEFQNVKNREEYLKHAREAYRKDVSALRKELQVVERNISTNTFQDIKYERIPSHAMSNYSPLFVEKDQERFMAYLDDVADGKKAISGATLLPSTMVLAARSARLVASTGGHSMNHPPKRSMKSILAQKQRETQGKVVDAQWKTLVQRIKDSGNLESSIAVCDVSGSMDSPVFGDGTRPMDSSIGLSLLVAEVCKPPFGGAFITFSERPYVVTVDLSKSFSDKVRDMEQAHWGGSTNFVSVFEDLILPMAINNKLKQEDMVKQIFVFSDMQFDQASNRRSSLSTAYERLQALYAKHEYEMPQLIFWNLAGGRHDYYGDAVGNTAPKPVTVGDNGTALVSGYSQGMLKVFLDNGTFDDPDEEMLDEKVEATGDGDEITVIESNKKRKIDPLSTVKKAVSHKAYDMFKVVD